MNKALLFIAGLLVAGVVALSVAYPPEEQYLPTRLSPDKLVPIVACVDENGLPFATIVNPHLKPPSLSGAPDC